MSTAIASTTVVDRPSVDSKQDYVDESINDPGHTDLTPLDIRPPLDYSSVGGFCSSLWKRFASIWTKRFVLSLLAGQVVSLCITCTNVTTTELVMRNWSLPTTQTFFLCVLADLYTEQLLTGDRWRIGISHYS